MTTETQVTAAAAQRLPADLDFGLGTWAWGDTRVWGYGGDYAADDVRVAFRAAIDAGAR